MEFGWVNLAGACIVILMLIPNIVYALRNKDEKNLCTNRFMNVIEQIGRYACITLMWIPLLVWRFDFANKTGMLVYLAGNGILLTAYWIVFMKHMKKKSAVSALVLAILPSCIFLISGLLLHHWLLVGFSFVFAAGHIYVTWKNVFFSIRN